MSKQTLLEFSILIKILDCDCDVLRTYTDPLLEECKDVFGGHGKFWMGSPPIVFWRLVLPSPFCGEEGLRVA